MLAIITVLVYLSFSLLLMGIALIWRRFRFSWLLAALASLAGWIMMLLQYPPRSPVSAQVFSLPSWAPLSSIPIELSVRVDPVSWSVALAIASLCLASILSDAARPGERNWSSWSGSLSLTGLAILAALAGSPVILLLAWTALDIGEVLVLLVQGYASRDSEPVVVIFSIRLIGSLVCVGGMLHAVAAGESLSFDPMTSPSAIFLLVGAGLRLGVLPFYPPLSDNFMAGRSLRTIFHLAPVAACLVLLTRVATVEIPGNTAAGLLLLTGIVAAFSAFAWLTSPHGFRGRRYWSMGMACLVAASALRHQPQASLAWSLVLLLPGGLFLLSDVIRASGRLAQSLRRLQYILAGVGLLGILALPYTPAWNGLFLYSLPSEQPTGFISSLALYIFFPAAQALLITGYARHFLRRSVISDPGDIQRWDLALYGIGLFLLPLVQFGLLAWIGQLFQGPGLILHWPLLVTALLVGLGFAWFRNQERSRFRTVRRLSQAIVRFITFRWLYQLIDALYRLAKRATGFISMILEGEGGVLWALLLLVLLLTVVAGVGTRP
jgi:hypothetical protein